MTHRLLHAAAALCLAAGLTGSAAADEPTSLRVVCTLPHLGAIAEEIGGDRVSVQVLVGPQSDPHFIQPTPGLMSAASMADLFVEVGMGLELWTERVLDGARNAAIRVGGPGHVYGFRGVPRLEVPEVLSRAEGDIHGMGNPHVWLHPLNGKIIAKNIAEGLTRVDPGSAAIYRDNLERFRDRVDRAYFGDELVELVGASLLERLQRSGKLLDFLEEREYQGRPLADRLGGWLGRMRPLNGTAMISYHKTWAYFADAFGVEVVGELEPKPGIPPTPGHLARLERRARDRDVRLVICVPYYSFSTAKELGARIGTPALRLPIEPGIEGAEGYLGLFDTITERMAAAVAAAER